LSAVTEECIERDCIVPEGYRFRAGVEGVRLLGQAVSPTDASLGRELKRRAGLLRFCRKHPIRGRLETVLSDETNAGYFWRGFLLKEKA
jgi:hypothetical protein